MLDDDEEYVICDEELRLVLYFKETSTFSKSLLCSDVSASLEGGCLVQQRQ